LMRITKKKEGETGFRALAAGLAALNAQFEAARAGTSGAELFVRAEQRVRCTARSRRKAVNQATGALDLPFPRTPRPS